MSLSLPLLVVWLELLLSAMMVVDARSGVMREMVCEV